MNHIKNKKYVYEKIKTVAIATILSATMISCGGGKDPVVYNNEMMTIINSSQGDMEQMNAAMMSNDYAKAEQVRKTWESKLEKQIKDVEALGDYNGDATFKNEVLKAMNDYKTVVTQDYKKLIEIRKSGVTAQQAIEDATLNKINQTLENAANNLNIASTDFETLVNKK